MREEEQLTGIVLYTSLVGEYDKRLVVLTKERGKITVFANGARRPNSTFRAASQSFIMGKFTVVAGRDAYNLVKVDVSEYFSELQMDMEKMCYASYFGELMSYYTREGDSCINNLNLLYVSLKALIEGKMPLLLIKAVYELRLMDIEGQGIHAYSCVKCGTKENAIYFNAQAGGLLCPKCARVKDDFDLDKSTIYTLQYILSAPLGKLFSFTLTEEVQNELMYVTDKFVRNYIDKKFNSLEILASLA